VHLIHGRRVFGNADLISQIALWHEMTPSAAAAVWRLFTAEASFSFRAFDRTVSKPGERLNKFQ